MKALFVNPGKTAYGSGQSMLAMLESRRFCAEVVCPPGGPLEKSLREMGVKHHPLEFGKYAFFHRPDWQFSFYRRFGRILRESQPDVVVINLDGNTPLVTLAAVLAGIPLIRFSRFEFKPPQRWQDKWCWLKASAVICPSELVRQQVLEWAPVHFRQRVHCWYDPHVERPVSDAEITKLREELGLGMAKTLVFVGRLHPLKRIETAIRALREIRKTDPDTRLLIVGSHDGSGPGAAYEKSHRDLAGQLGLQDSVRFLGYRDRDEVPVVIAAADACILPSESESFGMVLTEAWSVRVPTVASDVGGCREITLASGGGVLVPVGDHQGFAVQILKLLQNPALAKKHGAAGEVWVKANCDSKAYSERFHRLLKEVAKSGRAGSLLRAASPTVSITENGSAGFSESQPGAKVCIATFYHESHPGGVLQAYALSKTLNNLGHRAEMLAYRRPVRDPGSRSLRQQVMRMVTRASRRDASYAAFRAQFLNETAEQFTSYKDIVAQPPQAGAYVCGSDQIWNPTLLAGNEFDPAYFLQFGAEDVPRISYAASLGGHMPNAAQCELIQKYLARFSHISVREPSAQTLLKRILGRDVALTLDPTLLVDSYDELLAPADGHRGYVLLYALQNSAEIRRVARSVAGYLNKPLWSYGGPVLPWKVVGNRKAEEGPVEWLNLLKSADAVVTNSYHGVIFGLLFRKHVVGVPLVGGQEKRNNRLFHLCDMLGIRQEVIPADGVQAASREIDWDSFNKRLFEQRAASLAFLRSAMPTT